MGSRDVSGRRELAASGISLGGSGLAHGKWFGMTQSRNMCEHIIPQYYLSCLAIGSVAWSLILHRAIPGGSSPKLSPKVHHQTPTT